MNRMAVFGCVVAFFMGCIADPDDGEGSGGDDGAGGMSTMGGSPSTGGVSGAGGASGQGGEPGMGGEIPPVRVPLRHRAVAEACDRERPPGNVNNDVGAQCSADEDCTDGENGRCIQHRETLCTYDGCFDDGACDGFACECEGGWGSDHNICLRQGNCLVDADCGEGGYCSPSLGDCGDYGGTVGYFCHTPQDECIDDADCGGMPGSGGSYCRFNPAVGHWSCDDSQCVG